MIPRPTPKAEPARVVDVLVIGGGQAGLAAGFHLHRRARDAARGRGGPAPSYAILDANARPGGAWQHYWDTLELFSPAAYSSLPGYRMPAWDGPGNPSAGHVVSYLGAYEDRYGLPVHRPVTVHAVEGHPGGGYLTHTDRGTWVSRVVVNATGSWRRPFIPRLPGADAFAGAQVHTTGYRSRAAFAGARVAVIGGGNSGAQIAADLLPAAASVTWVTRRPPRYLPDDVDGRALFALATDHVQSRGHDEHGRIGGVGSLGDIVAVPAVRQARDAGRLEARPMFSGFTATGIRWDDGRSLAVDTVLWCTGFRPDLGHLRPLGLTRDGRNGAVPATTGDPPTRSRDRPGMYFLGYGDWVGAASATLIGVGAPARATVASSVITSLRSSGAASTRMGP
ncbi:SidA/IucD/PvdA family monooxygenase [Pseudactinotalea sp. HY160]|uniref:ArsO family NAD(P)H-dependent flavin-containing monooxygenase n=1 Tax=Pseudactinotalea sp. HY160 TaxID=2654490 RepID=UPI00128E0A39|nr:ArsO family NAD(P)H-dependent flavin-containing monooxygenase [Pseudactinotalea sp. HY160]MPV50973.1 SidA/IucD/PvdA family monooxygenase [Pseudactinotalea sp. HY160]